jgi:signal transduction histidine kinase
MATCGEASGLTRTGSERTQHRCEVRVSLRARGCENPLPGASFCTREEMSTAAQVAFDKSRKGVEEERERVRQLETELAHMNRVTTMGELTASLAHEIQQPIAATITSATACLQWLAREEPDIDRARESVKRIVKDVMRASEIISRVRSLYKKSPTQRELVDMNEVVHEMLALLRSEANQYWIAMRTELAAELPKVEADRVQLQQVLMNLMLNGIQAMKDTGGELTVKSQVGWDGQLMVSIRDTGVGLPTEHADQIFAAFFTTKPEGSGMGLAISRSIVESHGGRLWAAANSGPGATFYFTVPCQAEAVQASGVSKEGGCPLLTEFARAGC